MKYGWNLQSAFWSKSEAAIRLVALERKGQKAKITKKIDKETNKPMYHVWMWWKYKK